MKKITILVVALLLFAFILSSCKGFERRVTDEPLSPAGNTYESSDGMVMEFFKDTVKIPDKYGIKWTYDYFISSDNKKITIKPTGFIEKALDFFGEDSNFTSDFSITKDSITVDGKVYTKR